ncbi:hypothetical protein [Paracidovorax oryzae]|uniref:hypothetical protein n=1 Tax=Paracidovorax oryzae TaxID=862720 RepID=UPI0035D0CEF9
MKAILHIIAGVILGLLLGVLASAAFSRVFGAGYPLSDERSNILAAVLVFVVLPAFALAGALMGYVLHRWCAVRARSRSPS